MVIPPVIVPDRSSLAVFDARHMIQMGYARRQGHSENRLPAAAGFVMSRQSDNQK